MKHLLILCWILLIAFAPLTADVQANSVTVDTAQQTTEPTKVSDVQLLIEHLKRHDGFMDARVHNDLQRQLVVMRMMIDPNDTDALTEAMLAFKDDLALYHAQNRMSTTAYELLRKKSDLYLLRDETPIATFDQDWNNRDTSHTLAYHPPEEAGLTTSFIDEIDSIVHAGMTTDQLFPGAVTLVGKDGKIVQHEAYGDAYRFDADGEELPSDEKISMQTDTIFDLASLTKTFTATAVMQLEERGWCRFMTR
ncbi:hypothetical protein JCM19039_3173 [Geomicrobium sp. JCM 19039]|nr:hypothetical protein JCM19039_3173 [Geomicrobium sp. JCM 19039]